MKQTVHAVTVHVDAELATGQPALPSLRLPRVPVRTLAVKVEPQLPPGTTVGGALRDLFAARPMAEGARQEEPEADPQPELKEARRG